MDQIEFINTIEDKFDVKSIKFQNIEIWPILRIYYRFQKLKEKYNETPSAKNKKGELVRITSNIFFGLTNIFKPRQFLLITDIEEYRAIKGQYVNKLSHQILKFLGISNFLIIERTRSKSHHQIGRNKQYSVTSFEKMEYIAKLFSKIFKHRIEIENEHILHSIYREYGTSIDYKRIIAQFQIYRYFSKFLLKFNQPHAIFVVQYYHVFQQALIYEAKLKSIPVMEFQHGLINENHISYYFNYHPSSDLLPDVLLSYGNNLNQDYNPKFYIEKSRIIPIGSYLLEQLLNDPGLSKKQEQRFTELRNKYRLILAVASQDPIEDKLIDFISKAADQNSDILFIFISRRWLRDYNAIFQSSSNIITLQELNVYQVIAMSDFHVTAYSTTALEAPAMGVQNILINIDNLSKVYLGKQLGESITTKIVSTVEEFCALISDAEPMDRHYIKEQYGEFFVPNHRARIEQIFGYFKIRSR